MSRHQPNHAQAISTAVITNGSKDVHSMHDANAPDDYDDAHTCSSSKELMRRLVAWALFSSMSQTTWPASYRRTLGLKRCVWRFCTNHYAVSVPQIVKFMNFWSGLTTDLLHKLARMSITHEKSFPPMPQVWHMQPAETCSLSGRSAWGCQICHRLSGRILWHWPQGGLGIWSALGGWERCNLSLSLSS